MSAVVADHTKKKKNSNGPWTHTSDDSYIYQLSLVLATVTISYLILIASAPKLVFNIHTFCKSHVGILISRRRNECQEHL